MYYVFIKVGAPGAKVMAAMEGELERCEEIVRFLGARGDRFEYSILAESELKLKPYDATQASQDRAV